MSLSHIEAQARAQLISVQSYDVRLDLREGPTFTSRTEIRFTCSEAGAETFLELTDGTDVAATLNGTVLSDEDYTDRRIRLVGLTSQNIVVVDATLPYVRDGEGMHHFIDPADGATYISAYCGMDATQRVFACFSQPDLKAPITLAVQADPAWTVLSNGALASHDGGHWTFAPTQPISPYLFTMCAGPWHSVRFEHAGTPFAWHSRASLADQLDRDAEELKRITTDCFDYYTTVFDEPYVFGPYDQVMVPGLNWGAMETPGCITFRDELLFRGQATEAESGLRAAIIAHEMAHMWFGDLVTMQWWDDSWLSESFADYMGFQVSSAAAGYDAAWTGFALRLKGYAYAADERRSTHPVAPGPGSVADVDTAIGFFDSISYGKGNSAVRQLVTWLGEDEFFAGVNAYLSHHRFGNASLDDFVSALDDASSRDVRVWSESWLRTTGFDTLRVVRDGAAPTLLREGARAHRTRVATYAIDGDVLQHVGTQVYDVADAPIALTDSAGLVVIPNAHDETFARVRLDPASWDAVVRGLSSIDEPLTRAVLWATAFDMVSTAELRPEDFLTLVERHLPTEEHPLISANVINRTGSDVLVPGVPSAHLPAAQQRLFAACTAVLEHQREPSNLLAATRGQVRHASANDVALLKNWLMAGTTDHGVPVEQDLRWSIVWRLAELGATDAAHIATEHDRDPSAQGEQSAARALAALPTPEAKAAAWDALFGAAATDSNRTFGARAEGFWSAGQADLVAAYVPRYFAEVPSLAQGSQGSAQSLGTAFPLHAATPETVRLLRAALDAEPPTVLRRIWEDRLDDLERAIRIRASVG